MSTMVYHRVVSTKLTEEEHSRLLDVCNTVGCTPSYLIKEAIMKMITPHQKTIQKESSLLQMLSKELNPKPLQERREFTSLGFAQFLGT